MPRTPSSARRHQSYNDRDRYQSPTTPTTSSKPATPAAVPAPESPRRSLSQSHVQTHSRSASGATGNLANVARRDFEQSNVASVGRPPSVRRESRDAAVASAATALPSRSDSTRNNTSSRHARYNSSDVPPSAAAATNGSTNSDAATRQTGAASTSNAPRRRTTIECTTGLWDLGKTIGAGSMGKVKLAKNRETGEQVRRRHGIAIVKRTKLTHHIGCCQDCPASVHR